VASTLETLAFELAQGLRLPGRSLSTRRGMVQVLHVLGWAPPPGVMPTLGGVRFAELFTRLEATQKAIGEAQFQAGGGEVSASLNLGYAELLSSVLAVIDDLKQTGNSFATLPANYLAQTSIQAEFLPRLLNYLIVQSLAEHHPAIFQVLSFLGVIQVTHFPADEARFQTEHDRPTIGFNRLGAALSNPTALLQENFRWGLPTFDVGGLMAAIALILRSVGARIEMTLLTGADEQLILGRLVPEADVEPMPQLLLSLVHGRPGTGLDVGVMLAGLRPTAIGGADGGIALGPVLTGTTERTFPLDNLWRLSIDSPMDLTPGVAVFQRAGKPAQLIVDLRNARVDNSPTDGFQIGLHYGKPDGGPRPLLAIPGGSRLQYQELIATLGTRPGAGGAELFLEVELKGGQFILSLDEASELLSSLIPKDAVRADFNLAIGWAAGRAYLRGSADLQTTFPVDMSFGPVDLQSVTMDLAPNAGKLPIEISATLESTLGPLTLLVERVGLTAAFDFPGGASGNLGPLNVDLGFKVPTGIGLALDAGPVTGGGYLALDPTGQRYGGVLQLKLPIANVVAFGIYEQVQGQASFVAVLGIRFNPGVQLSFGFALTGVGGLVGLNRRANVDVLRDRLASSAAGNVLFCEDPVKNAPTILGDLAAFFPAASNGFLVGPTLQISWLSPIVRLDIGILIEFPGPSKIVILGSIRAMLGLDETLALLYLRMDILGIIDFEQQLISIDAALVNSNALGIVRLTGGMAFRLSYGNNPYILLSVGGFHPRFDPGPLNIPRLARIGASLDISVVVNIYIRVELYVAFTSNTLQTGSRVEAGMDIGPLGVHGYFSFDALVQFKPFYFDLEYSAGFAVEVFGTSFCSVSIVGRISGPGPIVIYACGSVKLLFVRVSASATFELGESNGDTLKPIASPVHELAPELRQLSNLRTDGDDPTIVRRPGRMSIQGVLVSPKGNLIWEQKRAPLKTIIDRLGGVPLTGQHELHLDMPAGWTTSDEQDWFNPGSFTNLDLKASQSLNNATFQEMVSGLKTGSVSDRSAEVVEDYLDEIDLVKRPAKTRFDGLLVGAYLTSDLHSSLRERTTTPLVEPGPPKVVVKGETADVRAADGTLLYQELIPFQAFQLSRQNAGRIAVPTTDVTVDL
jgi:hypothetical protein